MKSQRRKKSINSIFRFPEIGGRRRCWCAELCLDCDGIVEYAIFDGHGVKRGYIQGGKTARGELKGSVWLWRNKRGSGGIHDENRPVNMKSRKDMLQAVRFAYLKTQDW